MSAAFIFKHWRKLAAGGVALLVIFLIGQIVDRVRDYGQARYEAGYQSADLECTKAREAAQIARDKQIAEIEAEERAKREALQARLDAQDAIITEKDKAIAEANARARKAAQDAQSQAMQDRVDSGTSCPLTGSVRDGYLNDVPAYNARHGH